jgi:hypothetical protein
LLPLIPTRLSPPLLGFALPCVSVKKNNIIGWVPKAHPF